MTKLRVEFNWMFYFILFHFFRILYIPVLYLQPLKLNTETCILTFGFLHM
jgi:hypothetical protein